MNNQDELYQEIIELYNNGEIDIKSVDEDGDSLLHVAALNGSLKLTRFLIDKGVNLLLENNSGMNALEIALQYGEKDISLLLLESGVEVKKADGSTILHIASKSDNIELVELLLKIVDINAKDNTGWTPIFWAVQEENFDTVDFLLRMGSDINGKDNLGISLIDLASSNGSTELVKLLINKGANVNSKRNDGITPLHMASAFGHIDVVKLLLKFNADVSCIDLVEKKTALDYAKDKNEIEIQKILNNNSK